MTAPTFLCTPPHGSPSRGGFTLPEVLVVLLLLALMAGIAAPLTARVLDGWASRSARDQALAILHRTRMLARVHGGARLAITADPAGLSILVRDSLVSRWPVDGDTGVRIVLPGNRESDELRFDALGLGVVTSRTLRFRRGSAESLLLISSRGRGRRP